MVNGQTNTTPVDDTNQMNNTVMNVVNDVNAPVVLNEVNQSDSAQEVEKKMSPLEALASKLAELKSELVQEVPEEKVAPVTEEIPVAQEQQQTDEINDLQQELTNQLDTEISKENPQVETQQPILDSMNQFDSFNNLNNSVVPDQAPALDSQMVAPTIEDINQESNTMINNELGDNSIQTPPTLEEQSEVVPELDLMSGTVTDSTQSVSELPSTEMPIPFDNMTSPVVEEVPLDTPPVVDQQIPNAPVVDAPTQVPQQPLVQEEVKEDKGVSVDDILAQYETNISGTSKTEESSDSTNTLNTNEGSAATHQAYALDIRKILDIAIERDASDILISVGYPVMARVDGALIAIHEQIVGPKNAEELIYPVLSEQKKELLEVNREVDLAYTHQYNGEARFRINAFYTRENLAAAFRLIPTQIRTIEELNLPPIYNQLANLKQGLVLVTGPTGHGKSTTLAAILQSVNVNRSVHLLTIEDPIEYIFPKAKAVVDQREMHDDTHSWTVALKSAMRQNPDVILVGEMRDFETISAAITLAETGHLVFATLHTNSASQTIDRIIDVFPENQQSQVRTQLASILEAVIAQRLIPIDGGGRRAVSEILIGTPAIRNLIREGKAHQMDNVIRTSSDVGMISLESSLVKLVREGLITMDKAQEYAVHPEEVVRILRG